jgi:acylphosphatase
MSATDQNPPNPAIACLVRYTGRVQGVGFRATAQWLARSYPVTGWVRNLPDGRVELLAEGAEIDVQRFLAAVREHWGRAIRDEQVQRQEPSGRFASFGIAH